MRTTGPGQSALLLLDIIDILNERHIAYAIIGAFAASFYGFVRASLDVDAVISAHTMGDARKLCEDLRAKGVDVVHRTGDVEDPIRGVVAVTDAFHNRVDLLTGIQGVSDDIFQRSQAADFMGSAIRVVGPEDFIALKIFAGSPKDIQDIFGVLDISGKNIDLNLLKELTSRFGQDYLNKLQTLLKDHPIKQ